MKDKIKIYNNSITGISTVSLFENLESNFRFLNLDFINNTLHGFSSPHAYLIHLKAVESLAIENMTLANSSIAGLVDVKEIGE